MEKWSLILVLCAVIVFLLVRYRAVIFGGPASFPELDLQPVRSPFERYYPEISPDGAALCEAVAELSSAYEEIAVGAETVKFSGANGGLTSILIWVSVGGHDVASVEYEVRSISRVKYSEHCLTNWDRLTRSAMFSCEKRFMGEPAVYEPAMWEAIRPALLARHQELLPIQAEIRERENARIVAERKQISQNLLA
jgi:hypothetical protein